LLVSSKRKTAVGIAAAAAVFAALVFWLMRDTQPSYPDERRISWRFEVQNTGNQPMTDARLWIYAPVPAHPTQVLRDLEVDAEHTVVDDEHGNRIIELSLDMLPPYGSREVRASATVFVAVHNPWKLDGHEADWLQPQAGIQSGAEPVVALARELKRRTGRETLQSIEAWLRANLDATGYDAVDRGALHALEQRTGDCTEFAYLAVALARALGMPARAVDGWVIQGDALLEPSAFHTWAEVWDRGSWRRLDAHRDAEDGAGVHYLVMRIVPPIESAFASTFTRFRIEGSGLVARMK
jgi:transglutaminase-like putative cysteine protease